MRFATTTHVTNGCPYPIWVICDSNRQNVINGALKLDK